MPGVPLFEQEDFRRALGPALRPGGLFLTGLALEHCRLPVGSLVADIGCGQGATLALLSGRGYRPVGIDPSLELMAEAARSVPGALLAQGTAEALPLAGGRFAAAFCECVLSLIRDPKASLAEIRRVLAPGGVLVITDLYLREPPAPADASVLKAQRAPGCATGAVTRQEIESRLSGAGFSIRVFSDHSRLLAELAANLLFAGVSRQALGICGPGSGRPGYYLCIAQKEHL